MMTSEKRKAPLSNGAAKLDLAKSEKGFTLIELLVTISIIGVLATLILANFNAARERSRDAQRKNDLRQLQNSLRLYYNDKGQYPGNSSDYRINCGASGQPCDWGTADWSPYINPIPDDPASGRDYRYSQNTLDGYILEACIENRSDASCSGNASWCASSTGCIFKLTQ